MSVEKINYQAYINGRLATVEQLSPLAFAGFAHFTAMQVRDRKVKGLDLHLSRLHTASMDFFGNVIADEQLKLYMKTAIDNGPEDQSLTVTIFSPSGEFNVNSMNVEPEVLIRAGAPSNGPNGPLKLAAINHERPLATIKHVGEVGKTYYLHQAVRQGFDDAAFVDRYGRLSEATIWNLVFWDGENVIWPEAEILDGTMMGIVKRQLDQLGIPQAHKEVTLAQLDELSGAAVMNSWTPGISVTTIASKVIPESKIFMELLHKAYAAEPAHYL